MDRLSANSRRQIDSVLQTTAGKEVVKILTANLELGMLSILYAQAEKVVGKKGLR